MATTVHRPQAADGPRSFKNVVTYPEESAAAAEQHNVRGGPSHLGPAPRTPEGYPSARVVTAATPSSPGARVQHDSLALKSPLEQLSRSLSFNKDRQTQQHQHRVDVKGKGRAHEHDVHQQDDREMLDGYRNDLRRPPPLLKASDSSGTGFLKYDADDDTGGYHPTSTTAPVNFDGRRSNRQRSPSTDDEDNESNSDARSQLINAFRHSRLTRADDDDDDTARGGGGQGGHRDSSYSWMTTDPESPNTTLDFRQAQAVFEAAHHRGEGSSRPGSSSGLHASTGSSNSNNGQQTSNLQEEWEGDTRARARASSWDSQAAANLGLDRMPSQKSTRSTRSRSGDKQQRRELGPNGQPRESGLSVFDPFHYAVSLLFITACADRPEHLYAHD